MTKGIRCTSCTPRSGGTCFGNSGGNTSAYSSKIARRFLRTGSSAVVKCSADLFGNLSSLLYHSISKAFGLPAYFNSLMIASL